MGVELYILTVQVNIGQQGRLDLPAVMCKLNQLLCSYTDVARCLHKYKVCKQGSVYMLSETNLFDQDKHARQYIHAVIINQQKR